MHTARETALELASNLVPIRPLRPGLKRPWPGPDGKALTLSHPDTVENFWDQHPEANVGACLAPIDLSPLLVVDIDICDVAPAERARVWAHLRSLGVTAEDSVWVQRTGRDNWQVFYWAFALGERIPMRHVNAGGLHIDLLSNGYVVAAPSDTSQEEPRAPGLKGGGQYRWLRDRGPWDLPLSAVREPPDALMQWWRDQVALLPDPSLAHVHLDTARAAVATPIRTHRNVTLTSIAGALALRHGPVEMATRLHAINQARCIPPLPDREVEAILRSIGGREDGNRIRNLGAEDDELRYLR